MLSVLGVFPFVVQQLAIVMLENSGGTLFACQKHFWELRVPTRLAPARGDLVAFPAGAAGYLAEQRFRGNVMVPFEVGAFLSWKLFPAVKVSIDSRYEVAYPPSALEESLAFYDAEKGWEGLPGRYLTDAVLIPRQSRLGELVEKSPPLAIRTGWRCVYRDDAYSLYVDRQRAAGLPVVDRQGQVIQAGFP